MVRKSFKIDKPITFYLPQDARTTKPSRLQFVPPISKTFSNAVDDADAFETAHVSKHLSPLLGSALERELWLSVGSHGTPSGLDLWLACKSISM